MPDHEEWYDLIPWYKVLWNRTDALPHRLISQTARGKAEVAYWLDEWTEAPDWLWKLGYGLCVYQDPDAARAAFRLTGTACELWECRVANVLEQSLPPRLIVWQLADGVTTDRAETGWTKGTTMVQRVMLTKFISDYNAMFND